MQDIDAIRTALVLAIAVVVLRRFVIKALIAILAIVAMALIGAGLATIAGIVH